MRKFFQGTKKLLRTTRVKWDSLKKQIVSQREQKEYPKEEKYVSKKGQENIVVDISVSSITKGALAIIGILVLIYFLYSITAILALLFVSLILAAAIDPVVDTWEKRKFPRWLTVLILYLLFLFVFGAVVYSLIPLMLDQIITLTQNIGRFINNILSNQNVSFPFSKEIQPLFDSFIKNIDKQQLISELQKALTGISTQLASIAGNSLLALGAIFNGLFNALLVMVITFFMVVDKMSMHRFFQSLIPNKYAHYYSDKISQMRGKIGSWVRGQFILCLTIGILTYIGLFVLQWCGIDIQYKETLAVVAGATEIIPYIGPVIGALPALLIAANVSGWAIFWIFILYFVIQQLENNIIVNMVMNKEVGLNPIIIMVAMLIGAQFFGILGILLSIPVATSISVLVQDYIDKEK